jgi:CHAT domain-containing protein
MPAALASYQSALNLARELGDDLHIAITLNNMAGAAIESGRLDQAEQYNRQALELERRRHDRAHELYSLQNQAWILAAQGEPEAAEKGLREVIAGSADDPFLRWHAQARLARLLATQGKTGPARREFAGAIRTVDAARLAEKEEFRLPFLSQARAFYGDYIEFLMQQQEPREALRIAEHARARTLTEALGLGLMPSCGPQATGTRAPQCREAAGNRNPASRQYQPEETARRLNAVILSYWLTANHSYLWAVSAGGIKVYTLPSEAEIAVSLQSYREALMGPQDVRESANAAGLKLYRMLAGPAAALIPPGTRVVLIPDGALTALNFETLLVPASAIHYWIEDVTISNASSMALLAAAAQRRYPPPPDRLLAIGDPVQPGREFSELPQARLEIARVAQYFGQSLVITREKATPRAYAASHPEEFGYIHFAAHASASRLSPLDSSIALSRDGDSYELFAREIIRQPLRAQLVTLSACQSAGTRAYAGEGLVGLAWAFLHAGAHHVIAASWEVSDTSAPQLMDSLYRNLRLGEDAATALRNAKLGLLRSEGAWSRPLYWAAFQLYSGA